MDLGIMAIVTTDGHIYIFSLVGISMSSTLDATDCQLLLEFFKSKLS